MTGTHNLLVAGSSLVLATLPASVVTGVNCTTFSFPSFGEAKSHPVDRRF